MEEMLAVIVSKINYWAFIVLMMIGMYGILTKSNFMKKIIGLSILQTAVILFYISIAAKQNATIPIITHGHNNVRTTVTALSYINPLPHVLMLTAIVVAVATLGVALAITIKIYQQYGTLEEDELIGHLTNNRDTTDIERPGFDAQTFQ